MKHQIRLVASRHRFLRDPQGAAALEFAIIAPVLLVILMGILCYGMYFGAMHGVEQLAAEAARASISGLDSTERKTLAKQAVAKSAPSYPFITPEKLIVTASDTDPASGTFSITLTYDASSMSVFSLPYVPLPDSTITRSASIQRGGF